MPDAPFTVPGVDVVVVADIAASVDRFGERYLQRTFTRAELTAAPPDDNAHRIEHLAGRFAAKEAVVKAIRYPRSRPMSWLEVEVVNAAEGWPVVHLAGALSEWSRTCGIHVIELSISHDGGVAVAVAMAQWDQRNDGERGMLTGIHDSM